MLDIHFEFIGWNHENGHDKVWVAFKVDESWYCGWGKRGAKLQFKSHGKSYYGQNNVPSKLMTLRNQKENKGYKTIDNLQLFAIFPDFDEKVKEELLCALLGNKLK